MWGRVVSREALRKRGSGLGRGWVEVVLCNEGGYGRTQLRRGALVAPQGCVSPPETGASSRSGGALLGAPHLAWHL